MMNAMMERMGMSAPTSGMPGTGMAGPASMPAGMNMMMVPRCTLKMEKCPGGMKMTCTCEDKVACGMVQSLCTMLAGGLCSCCLVLNGLLVCCCNLTMGLCKWEMTEDGCTITCTSGDKECCAMIQACCDCCTSMMKAGCTCCVMMNGMPVCCGC